MRGPRRQAWPAATRPGRYWTRSSRSKPSRAFLRLPTSFRRTAAINFHPRSSLLKAKIQMIDFEKINQAALRNGRALVQELIPSGKIRSLEYVVRNPRRNDQNPGSFSINYRTGTWKDFAAGDAGRDLISLVAYIRGCGQGDAARELAEKLGVPLRKSENSALASASQRPDARSPVQIEAPKVHQWGQEGPPIWPDEVRRHAYRDSEGQINKIKIKKTDGNYNNWYPVQGGWQAKKPDNFQPVPYISASINPFDPELAGDQILWPEGEKDVDTLGKLKSSGVHVRRRG